LKGTQQGAFFSSGCGMRFEFVTRWTPERTGISGVDHACDILILAPGEKQGVNEPDAIWQ
jgi:hypothetical protein